MGIKICRLQKISQRPKKMTYFLNSYETGDWGKVHFYLNGRKWSVNVKEVFSIN